jgi:hypothetical protein
MRPLVALKATAAIATPVLASCGFRGTTLSTFAAEDEPDAATGDASQGFVPSAPPVPCSRSLPREQGHYCHDSAGCDVERNGFCASVPPSPVCGSDAVVYATECDAHAAGALAWPYVWPQDAGACEAPRGMFACGPVFCRVDEDACLLWSAPGPKRWSCIALPEACKRPRRPADCTCYQDRSGSWDTAPCWNSCVVQGGNFMHGCATE